MDKIDFLLVMGAIATVIGCPALAYYLGGYDGLLYMTIGAVLVLFIPKR